MKYLDISRTIRLENGAESYTVPEVVLPSLPDHVETEVEEVGTGCTRGLGLAVFMLHQHIAVAAGQPDTVNALPVGMNSKVVGCPFNEDMEPAFKQNVFRRWAWIQQCPPGRK